MKNVIVTGGFDDLRSRHVRFLQEAARLGRVHALLRSDEAIEKCEGRAPKFPQEERRYLLESIRYVDRVSLLAEPMAPESVDSWQTGMSAIPPPDLNPKPDIWAVDPADHSPAKEAYCRANQIEYHAFRPSDLIGFPQDDAPADQTATSSAKRVMVTGCYDWFHSGHVRFFEEVSQLGDLYVVVGHDANIRLLKGEGHPLFPEQERRYMVAAVRFVKQALISSGHGWLDAEPEIELIRPHIYAVNEDGDRPEKRAYCQTHGIEYRVLKRLPKPGLPARQSTDLRNGRR
jgi:cytidyltransferase-like protein